MKYAKRITAAIAAIIIALAAGCTGGETGPAGGKTGDADSKYTLWKSGRKAPSPVSETSKTVDSYEPAEGTANEFTVARYYGDNMIVPRDRKIVIWGTAPESENGKTVAAEFKGLKGSGVIEGGSFSFALNGTLPASGEKGHSLIVRGAEGIEKKIDDVLVGDIWVVSGQSNADLTFMGTVAQSQKDILALYGDYLDGASEDDNIRILQQINWSIINKAGEARMAEPQTDILKTNRWQIATRRKVYGGSATNSFSMLGYFFAKELYTLNPEIPIGIAMAGCGGAPLSLLASPEANAAFPAAIKDRTLMLNGITIPPSGIYNAFLAPMLNVGITGMIFYQGESDAGSSADYGDALKTMIEDYRAKFGSDLLFLNVQLTSYGYESGGVQLAGVWDSVPALRFSQSEVKIDGSIANYEIIPSIDIGWKEGDGDGAHPYYKLELGRRGAKMAAALLYGKGNMEDVACPVPSAVRYNEEEIVIEYSYTGGGLKTVNGGGATGFEVKVNGSWQKAEAAAEGNTVKIAVSGAEGVRYASDLRYESTGEKGTFAGSANLCSGTGNIAVPFCVEFG